jgi:hypothetical protein
MPEQAMFIDRSATTPFHFYIRPHALGVVVSRALRQAGALVMPGQRCFDLDFAELEKLARVWGHGTIPGSAVAGSPLDQRQQADVRPRALSSAVA